MLVLSRKTSERIQIGHDVTITITEIRGNRVRIGIDAPPGRRIVRQELLSRPAKSDEVEPTPDDALLDALRGQEWEESHDRDGLLAAVV